MSLMLIGGAMKNIKEKKLTVKSQILLLLLNLLLVMMLVMMLVDLAFQEL